MTDKEFVENIGTIETEELFNLLENIGCDGYYKNRYYPAIEELRKRKLLQRRETDGWILVSERLPEDRKCVLVTAYWHETYQVMQASYFGEGKNNGWWCVPFNNCGEHMRNDLHVIAWKPLPEPYKKGGEEK